MRRPLLRQRKMNTIGSAVAVGRRRGQEGREIEGVTGRLPRKLLSGCVWPGHRRIEGRPGCQNMYHERDGRSPRMSAPCSATSVAKRDPRPQRPPAHPRRDRRAINKKVHAAISAGLIRSFASANCASPSRADPGGHPPPVRRFPGGPSPNRPNLDCLRAGLGDGTGKVATPQQAEDVHLALRKIMAKLI